MSAPRRLIEEGATSLEMALLRSAKDDDPPPDALPRAMIAAGVGGAALSGAATTSLLAKPASGLLKWALNLMVGAAFGLAGGAMFMGEGPSEARPTSAQSTAALTGIDASSAGQAEARPETAREATSGVDLPTLGQSDLSAASPPPRAPHKSIPHAQKPRAPDAAGITKKPSLADEVALLDNARRALTAGDAEGALRALETHGKVFSGGALLAEAAVLRIEALAARGDRAGAISKARAFLSAFPKDPHANHVENILHEHEGREVGAEAGESHPR